MEGLRSIHDPGFGVVRDTMKSIGTTRSATIRFSKFSGRWELLQSGQTPSCFDPRRAGGSLLDIGIYTVEFAIGLFGAPDTVQATGVLVDVPGIDTALPYHQIDVSGQALLGYKDKVVNLSWVKPLIIIFLLKLKEKRAPFSLQPNRILVQFLLSFQSPLLVLGNG